MKKTIFIVAIVILVALAGYWKYKSTPTYRDMPEPVTNLTSEQEQEIFSNYFFNNLDSLSDIKPVLGGKWYVTKLELNRVSHEGVVYYEDGHISAKGTFKYNLNTYAPQKIYDEESIKTVSPGVWDFKATEQ